MNYMFMYMGIWGFNVISNQYFCIRYGFDEKEAGKIVGNIFLAAAFISPLWGYMIHRNGNKITFWIISSLLLILSQVLFMVIPSSESTHKSYYGLFPIWLLGLSYGVYIAAFASMIFFSVKPQAIASAYGIWTAFQNFGLAITPIITSILIDKKNGSSMYILWNVFYMASGIIAMIFAFLLLITDQKKFKKAKQSTHKMLEYTSSTSLKTTLK